MSGNALKHNKLSSLVGWNHFANLMLLKWDLWVLLVLFESSKADFLLECKNSKFSRNVNINKESSARFSQINNFRLKSQKIEIYYFMCATFFYQLEHFNENFIIN